MEITSSGVRAVMTKPAGKRDIVISVKGIHPSTDDEAVFDYLENFGKVISKKVVYGIFQEGPLRGMKNGDRCYKIELMPGMNIGSYHILDGQRVTLKYSGQRQTCARCLQTAEQCKGKGIARKCESEGGIKADFGVYILDLWRKIGYAPDYSKEYSNNEDAGIEEQLGGYFTPQKCEADFEKFQGVNIKNIPKDIDQGEIVEFLIWSGLPAEKKELVEFKPNGNVTIRDLENELCMLLINNIHEKRHFNRRLYCNGVIPLTPSKNSQDTVSICSSSKTPSTASELNMPQTPDNSDGASDLPSANVINIPTLVSPPMTPFWPTLEGADLARRHSLSLLDRTPPPGSLSAELLGTSKNATRRSSVLSDIKDITETLSDFNSCLSMSDSDSGNSAYKKVSKVRKRKKTPEKDDPAKKAKNLSPSRSVEKSK